MVRHPTAALLSCPIPGGRASPRACWLQNVRTSRAASVQVAVLRSRPGKRLSTAGRCLRFANSVTPHRWQLLRGAAPPPLCGTALHGGVGRRSLPHPAHRLRCMDIVTRTCMLYMRLCS